MKLFRQSQNRHKRPKSLVWRDSVRSGNGVSGGNSSLTCWEPLPKRCAPTVGNPDGEIKFSAKIRDSRAEFLGCWN